MAAHDARLATVPTSVTRADATAPRVASEVGRLRSVLVHRPGEELRAVDPANARRMLFAGPVDLDLAQAEHDALVTRLRASGVEVLYLAQMLADVAGDPPGRRILLELALPEVPAATRRRLALLAPSRIARALIAGLSGRELASSADLLRPLPNMLFVRDPAAWIGDGVVVGAMATGVRQREALLLDALCRLHPRLADAPAWTDAAPVAPRVEGGDVLVAREDRVMLGISPRTTTAGAHHLAALLLAQHATAEVLTVTLPRGAGFHLDLVLAMVDHDTFAVWAPARRALRAHRWRATSGGVAVCAVADPFSWLAPGARVIEVGSREGERHGRSWDHGVNVLAIAPGVVIAYADNGRANDQLTAAGIEVIAVRSAALARGRGGPRCLTCPLVRDDP